VRQILAIVAGTCLAGFGAVVLGEYDLRGTTAIIGFPLYGVAVAELGLAVGKRLTLIAQIAIAAAVGGGLAWALWISFGHFRNDAYPPRLSWAMVGGAVLATMFWGRWDRRRHDDREPVLARAGAAQESGEAGARAAQPSGKTRAGDGEGVA